MTLCNFSAANGSRMQSNRRRESRHLLPQTGQSLVDPACGTWLGAQDEDSAASHRDTGGVF